MAARRTRMNWTDANLAVQGYCLTAEESQALRRGLRFRNATDALIARRAGYPTVMLGSINRYKLPDNYHWPTDVPDNVDFSTTADAVALCHEVVQSLAV